MFTRRTQNYRTYYPDNELVTVRYNSMGLTDRVWSSTQGTLIDGDNNGGAEYDVEGRLCFVKYPSGGNLWLEHHYYPWTGGFSAQAGKLYAIAVGTSKGGDDRVSQYYEKYDSFANITYTRESGVYYSFNYDAQNRLTCAYATSSGVNSSCVSRAGKEYAYDLAGRLTAFEGNTFLPDPVHRHAVDKRNGINGYDYDANGNMTSRRVTNIGFSQSLSWDLENLLVSVTSGNSTTAESYTYDADGQRVKKVRGTVSTYYPNSIFESTRDQVWIDEGLPPAPTVAVGAEDSWNWVASPTAYSGSTSHASAINSGFHQHYFYNAPANYRVTPGTGDGLYAYVYLDPANPPSEVMLQWYDATGWEHRAYWGANNIAAGTDGSNSRRYMGPLPATGTWVRLEVPAALVGLENVTLDGMAYTLYGGRAWWDKAGVSNNTKYYTFNGMRFAMRKNGVTTYLHTDHLGSTIAATNMAGNPLAGEKYLAYGGNRGGAGVPTDRKFTGQIQDASGLQYFNSCYYDPQLGTFVSPDTIVPDPGEVMDFNRYMAFRGNPMMYNDPSGHQASCTMDQDLNWECNGSATASALTVKNDADVNSDCPAGSDCGFYRNFAIAVVIGVAPSAAALACANMPDRCMQMLSTSQNASEKVIGAVNKGLEAVQKGIGQGYNSFEAFKKVQGAAGSGQAWHHIVGQQQANISKFGSQMINNTNNLIRLPTGGGTIHQQITNYYNSIDAVVTGSTTMRVREWLATQPFEAQWKFGIELIKKYGGEQYIIQQYGGGQ